MKKQSRYFTPVSAPSRLSWQVLQAGLILGIFLLLLLACALLRDVAQSDREILHPAHAPGAPLESLPASTPCRDIEITAPDSRLRETQYRRSQKTQYMQRLPVS